MVMVVSAAWLSVVVPAEVPGVAVYLRGCIATSCLRPLILYYSSRSRCGMDPKNGRWGDLASFWLCR
jgi:hypothetical protein